jgi:hypothetical protein
MASRALALGVALLFVTAGCTAVTDTGLLGDRWEGDPDNHFRSETINVSYAGGDADRDYGPIVRAAADYWTEHSDRYAGFPVTFRVIEGREAADVHVRFVERIDDCGTHDADATAGCAPILTEPGQVDRPVDVRVRTDFSDASTVAVLKHEFGHTLGLTHADEPRDVMRSEGRLTTPPETNATDRQNPWQTDTLAVYTDDGDVPSAERAATDRQVSEALAYYDRGAGGTVPEAVSFRRVEDRAEADVVIEVTDESDCRAGTGSCGTVSGTDPDGDGALEWYTSLRIVVVGLDTEAVGWHVGRWLGVGFGHESESEYPPPLRESASYDERRSEWWTES